MIPRNKMSKNRKTKVASTPNGNEMELNEAMDHIREMSLHAILQLLEYELRDNKDYFELIKRKLLNGKEIHKMSRMLTFVNKEDKSERKFELFIELVDYDKQIDFSCLPKSFNTEHNKYIIDDTILNHCKKQIADTMIGLTATYEELAKNNIELQDICNIFDTDGNRVFPNEIIVQGEHGNIQKIPTFRTMLVVSEHGGGLTFYKNSNKKLDIIFKEYAEN